MQFNIYIENHGKRDGVEDFIQILIQILTSRGHEVAVSSRLELDHPNIIIDEFTNYVCNKKISSFKTEHPEAKLIYLLSEFVETRYGVSTFNFFGGILEASVIAMMNIFIRNRRNDYLPASWKDYITAVLHLPFAGIYYLSHLFENFLKKKGRKRIDLRKRLYSRAYLHMRYLGLQAMINYADGIMFAHEKNAQGINKLLLKDTPSIPVAGIIYPEIDFELIRSSLFTDKALLLEITGSITPYRRKTLHKIDKNILVLGMKNTFKPCLSLSFAEGSDNEVVRGAFSLHPPQNPQWKYSSPIRIYRALQKNSNMPVLTKYFKQNPIEDLCLIYDGGDSILQMYDFYQDKQKALEYLEPRIKSYMEIAIRENDQLVEKLCAISKSLEVNGWRKNE